MSENTTQRQTFEHTTKTYPIPHNFQEANISEEKYHDCHPYSLAHPDKFWRARIHRLAWYTPPHVMQSGGFAGDHHVTWFPDGVLNVSVNCVDRHLKHHAEQVAIVWEPDDPNRPSRNITYGELYKQVNIFANVLKSQGVTKGDRVCIYLPMIPEAIVAMLACARIGAIHSVVFGGFSSQSLADRINDAECHVVVTADQGFRGGKTVALKANVDVALEQCEDVHKVLVIRHTDGDIPWKHGRDVWYHHVAVLVDRECAPEHMSSEDPLFILYTSGSTGKPKGLVHSSAGYLLQALITFRGVLDYKPGECFWCTADIGWITGHTYGVYGPLAVGATTVLYEGVPTYPDASRIWRIVEKHKVNIFYTAPTLIRSLVQRGDGWVEKVNRDSLRVLGTVGEPINPAAWEWYHKVVGEERCPVVDTWWQTETGGHMITPLPGATPLKPGSAGVPFFGVNPALIDGSGIVIEGVGEGHLVIQQPWPGMARTIWGDHERYVSTYFTTYPGSFFTGDGARRDADGYYWITGRVDDVLNVSGHRLGTAEIESALVKHEAVAEAAVVGYPHDIKGQGIYAYITLMDNVPVDDGLRHELIALVRSEIGPIATIDFIQWAPGLPKTRSGKIMRRILRKIAGNDLEQLGDTSTLADPHVVDALTEGRVNR